MQEFISSLQDRLEKPETLFFKWLIRLTIAGVLVGTAWIDDAPPLELAALIITLYIVFRVVMQLSDFYQTAPFENSILRGYFAIFCAALLALSFLTVAIFTESVAIHVVQ